MRLLAASADALALLRFDMEVQHARAPNNSALPGAELSSLSLRSTCTLNRWGLGSVCFQQPQAQSAFVVCILHVTHFSSKPPLGMMCECPVDARVCHLSE